MQIKDKTNSKDAPVGKILCLFSRANELDNGKELLMSIDFLLFLQDEHEVVTETRLHHHPINGAGQIYVRR